MGPSPPSRKIFDILLVEDNLGDILLFKECLKNAKVPLKLHEIMDGEETLEFLEHRGEFRESPRPDLIIMELGVPKVDGLELLQKVKVDPVLRQIPVIVLTGSNAEVDVTRSYDLHANCYIIKPAELSEFIAVVKSIEHFWLELALLPPNSNMDKK